MLRYISLNDDWNVHTLCWKLVASTTSTAGPVCRRTPALGALPLADRSVNAFRIPKQILSPIAIGTRISGNCSVAVSILRIGNATFLAARIWNWKDFLPDGISPATVNEVNLFDAFHLDIFFVVFNSAIISDHPVKIWKELLTCVRIVTEMCLFSFRSGGSD